MVQMGGVTVVKQCVQPFLVAECGTVPMAGHSRFSILQPARVGAVGIVQKRGHGVHELKLTGGLFQLFDFERLDAGAGGNIGSGDDSVVAFDDCRCGNLGGTAVVLPVKQSRSFPFHQIRSHRVVPHTVFPDRALGAEMNHITVVLLRVFQRNQTELLQIRQTADRSPLLPSRIQRGKKQTRQNRDDRYYIDLKKLIS